MSCTSRPPTSFTAANISPCSFSAMSHVGARLMVASMAKTRRPRSPVAAGASDFILAMNAATSVSADASRAGTPPVAGEVAGAAVRVAPGAAAGVVSVGLRVIILEPSRRAIRLEHGDPRPGRQYPPASTAGNRRSGQQLQVSAGRGDVGRAHALGGVGEAGCWARPPWGRCPIAPRRRTAVRRRRRRSGCD